MRITTHMLNETARRTGIPVNQNNLLSYINESNPSGNNTLLDALKKNNDKGKVSAATAEHYKKLEKAAAEFQERSEKLAATGEGSFFEKIKESGNTDELYTSIEKYVDSYNSTLSALKQSPGVLNEYYSQMLQEAAADSSTSLEGIGITVGKDGALSIDKEKLHAASVEDIEKVFGGSGAFTSKTGFLAGRVADNAQANLESTSSQYDVSGNLHSQLASQFDLWG